MKTATITWVTYNNYGTLLQAYALQRYIRSLGHDNDIISDELILKDYQPRRIVAENRTPLVYMPFDGGNRAIRLLKNPRRVGRAVMSHLNQDKYRLPYVGSEQKCEEFKRTELNVRHGIKRSDASELNNDYDAFVCGSDQIWSVFEYNFNPYYYLDFVRGRKIAYAPSLGTDIITEDVVGTVKTLLEDYHAISVREQVSAFQLKSILNKKVEWVCDPTLLFDGEFWSEFTEKVFEQKDNYLLCYFLEARPWYLDYANTIAKKLHLKLMLIPNRWDYLCNENIIRYAVGPKEFVKLFKNASFILTDSYHGSIFSLLFERDFFYLQRFAEGDPRSQNIRIKSLFSLLGIMDRVLSDEKKLPDDWSIKDYARIIVKLNEHRDYSRAFLQDSLDFV